MNNNTTATVAVPMPAAMAGLIGDFTSTRGVLSELGRLMAAGGEFSDTVMGFDHPSMMDDRHDRITSDVCASAVLQASLAALTDPPDGDIPTKPLHTMAYYHIAEFCKAQVDHELSIVRTSVRTALTAIDVDSKLQTVYAALDDSENAALQAQASWTDLVQVGSNRIDAKVVQQQLVSDLQVFISSQVSKFQDRQKSQIAIASLRAQYIKRNFRIAVTT